MKSEYQTTRVRQGVSLAANYTILCGTTIGRYAFGGAGAVGLRDVADYAIVVGNPASVIGWMCSCGIKLVSVSEPPAEATCSSCGLAYINRHHLRLRTGE